MQVSLYSNNLCKFSSSNLLNEYSKNYSSDKGYTVLSMQNDKFEDAENPDEINNIEKDTETAAQKKDKILTAKTKKALSEWRYVAAGALILYLACLKRGKNNMHLKEARHNYELSRLETPEKLIPPFFKLF